MDVKVGGSPVEHFEDLWTVRGKSGTEKVYSVRVIYVPHLGI